MAENVLMSDMSWTEVEQALKERPIALLPVGNTEAHGPHLPLATDTVIAVEMARRTVAKLKQRGLHALIAPPITFSVSQLGADFPGTVSLPPDTAAALVRDVCLALSKKFRAVALVERQPGAREPRRAQGGRPRTPRRRAAARASPSSPRSAGPTDSAPRSTPATTPAASRPR